MGQRNYGAEELAEVYRLMGDKTRLKMAEKLSKDYYTISDFVKLFGISQPLASQHLKKLKKAFLLKEKRVGKLIYYKLNPNAKDFPLISLLLNPLKKSLSEPSVCDYPPADRIRKIAQ
ncbi:ArsR/SmtB family transcription factor [Jeotgalibacillus soli]|nr:metalloregulator ArsR/SmtB family transcription factor [Jeotgalibacillus soli]